ncbi:MAG: hypothetical protein ACAH17_02845 [Candidatus Paceibacterota bacterium]
MKKAKLDRDRLMKALQKAITFVNEAPSTEVASVERLNALAHLHTALTHLQDNESTSDVGVISFFDNCGFTAEQLVQIMLALRLNKAIHCQAFLRLPRDAMEEAFNSKEKNSFISYPVALRALYITYNVK